MMALSVKCGWNLWQIKVENAFVNAPLSEEMYIAKPQRFQNKGHEHKIYRLKKVLYGLKQAAKELDAHLHEF